MNVRSGLGIEREKRSRWEMGTRWERRTRSKRLRPDPREPFLDTRAVGMREAATGLQPIVTKKATSNIKIRATAFSGSTVGFLRARERRIDARRAAPGLGPPCLGRKEHRPARPGVSDRADMSAGRQGDHRGRWGAKVVSLAVRSRRVRARAIRAGGEGLIARAPEGGAGGGGRGGRRSLGACRSRAAAAIRRLSRRAFDGDGEADLTRRREQRRAPEGMTLNRDMGVPPS